MAKRKRIHQERVTFGDLTLETTWYSDGGFIVLASSSVPDRQWRIGTNFVGRTHTQTQFYPV